MYINLLRTRLIIILLIIISTLSNLSFAQGGFDFPFKIGSYFEYDYAGSSFNYRYYAKITRDTVINGKKVAILSFFDEPGMGNYDVYYRIDTNTLNIYNGLTQTCVDTTGFSLEAGFKLPVGYIWNTCDTSKPYYRSYIVDTSSYSNILNYNKLLKTVTRVDTSTGITSDGTAMYVFTEKFGFFIYSQSSSGPFGPYSIVLKGAIIDSVTYGSITLGINQISSGIPGGYSLKQNFPNPFNPSTNIRINLPKAENVKLIVYDQLGREVNTLIDERLNPGEYEYRFVNNNLSSGVYYYTLLTDNFRDTKRVILVK